MRKLFRYLYFSVAFFFLFMVPVQAYIDPSVMTYAIQAVAGVAIALGTVFGLYWRKLLKVLRTVFRVRSNKHAENESDEIGSEINFINASWDFLIQLDSQAFYGTDSRTTSKSKIGTLTLGINSYLTDNKLGTKIHGIEIFDRKHLEEEKENIVVLLTFNDSETEKWLESLKVEWYRSYGEVIKISFVKKKL